MSDEEDKEDAIKRNPNFVAVFAPRIICGEEVEPFCEPSLGTQQSFMIAAATNLIWWAMHEALADGKIKDALKCGDMMLDIVKHECSKEEWSEAKRVLVSIIKHYDEISDNEPPYSN